MQAIPVLIHRWLGQNIATLLSLLLLVGAGFPLAVYTLQLQHSCHPLLSWDAVPSTNCLAIHPVLEERPEVQKQPGKAILTAPTPAPKRQIDQAELISIATGSIVIAGLGFVGAPVVVAAGAGMAVWLATKTLISMNG